MYEILDLAVGALKSGAIYALAASGFIVIHKATKLVNFAHGAFIMLGAYGAFVTLTLLKWPYWVAYAAVPIIVGAIAALVEFLLLRPLRRADPFSALVATVFLGVAMMEIVRLAYPAELLSVPSVLPDHSWELLGGIVLTGETLWIGTGALLCVLLAVIVFEKLSIGRGMKAMASNYRGAQLSGYSVAVTYALAWFMGGALAGLAGVFAAPPMGINPDLAISLIVPAFVAAVIGGFDSLKGAIVGGLILALVEAFAATYISSAAKSAASFAIVFIFLLVRPEGLFASGTRRHA
ncbi:branched-chain amino acid ABC transporter permease [Tardiphaga robiniae]|uniref:Branched-chain amino acid ABC transporter permease n=1 Tax=Tardiphaga robiniae TaxID=943830 RepID=A0A7G6U1J4_9BRAD|nr:branched-chain amino acid ABC transporter permease [Tardiphaga robiniae]QND72876.1 branched-chain amino acid ABC transporter permease [Tardiphaga robiniae]